MKPEPKPKYSTITQLSAAFKSGELDSSYWVMIDKGGCALSLCQDGPWETENERYEECQRLFRREYANPLEELFSLAKIPARHC